MVEDSIEIFIYMALDQGGVCVCVCACAHACVSACECICVYHGNRCVCVPLSITETPILLYILKTFVAIILVLQYIIYNSYIRRWAYLSL